MFKRSLFAAGSRRKNPSSLDLTGAASNERSRARVSDQPVSYTAPEEYPLSTKEPSFPLQVKMSVKIVKILDIDTSSNSFHCDFSISAKWEDPAFLPVVQGKVSEKTVDMSRHFVPTFGIVNLIQSNFESPLEYRFFKRKDTNGVRVVLKQRIRGHFFEHMELKLFPFDIQSLTVRVRARHDVRTVQFKLASQRKHPSYFSGSRFSLPEWDFLTPKHQDGTGGTPYVWTGNTGKTTSVVKPHSYFTFNQPASRKIGYYVNTVLPVYFMTVALGWNAFANDITDNANRLNAVVALFLTSIAYKSTYTQHLPKAHYMTKLDLYGYFQLLFLALQAGEHAAAKLCLDMNIENSARCYKEEDIRAFEYYFVISIAAVWTFIHVVLYYMSIAHRRLLDLNPDELKSLLLKIEADEVAADEARSRGCKFCVTSAAKGDGADDDDSPTKGTWLRSKVDDINNDFDDFSGYELGNLFADGSIEEGAMPSIFQMVVNAEMNKAAAVTAEGLLGEGVTAPVEVAEKEETCYAL